MGSDQSVKNFTLFFFFFFEAFPKHDILFRQSKLWMKRIIF